MSEKTILTIAYSIVSAFGLWLIIDVDGWVATVFGIILMFFAGSGLAGMSNLKAKSPSIQLSSLTYANEFNDFDIDLSEDEMMKIYEVGQILAPLIKYPTSWDRPRVMPEHIDFPFCAVGEFTEISCILENRNDQENKRLLDEVILEFIDEFEDEIENLSFHFSS